MYRNPKNIVLVVLFIVPAIAYGQGEIKHRNYFSSFLDSTSKSLLIVGDNHTSSVGPTVYPGLIQYLNKKNGLNTLLIEFGPSEAYFYRLYLETGNEKWLNYTIYAGSYEDWRNAWKKIYHFNQTLNTSLEIIGIDFDRTRTFGYALYKIFSSYDNRPEPIDSLMAVISDTTFYNTYTIGYPKERGKRFVANTEDLLEENIVAIKQLLNKKDFDVIRQMLQNKAVGYGGNREQELARNVKRTVTSNKKDDFLLFIGRSHAYYKPIYGDEIRLAERLSKERTFDVLAGVILFENSKLWGPDYEEAITLHETQNKIPWKEYHKAIDKKAVSDLTIIPLANNLGPLSRYTNFIIVAREKRPIKVLQ